MIFYIVVPLCLILVLVLIIKFSSILTTMGDFLIVNGEPKTTDIIIVLEGGNHRIEYGANLFKLGYSNKILFTGGAGAHDMAKYALSLGVTEDNILIEDQSGTTFENAKYSLKIMRTQGFKSALVVTSPYHTRRSSIIFSQVFQEIDLTVCAVPYDSAMTHNWWRERDSARFVISEYLKLMWHYIFEKN